MKKKVVFIGHGRAKDWLELEKFLTNRLSLDCREFNSEPVAGYSHKERLEQLLKVAEFAFLIMTAEDEHSDGSYHARENVIHEVGLFQGKLGFEKAIVLLEEGCKRFSNIDGLNDIRFPKGQITDKFEGIRMLLENRGIVKPR
jgi:predicted nucleotide-binding protein